MKTIKITDNHKISTSEMMATFKKKCTHNGGKAYWNNMPGFKCLNCGEEVKDKSNDQPHDPQHTITQ